MLSVVKFRLVTVQARVKHVPPITAYTRVQAPYNHDVNVTSHDSGSHSETPCIVATETADLVTPANIEAWPEHDDVMNSHLLTTDKFVDDGDANAVTSFHRLAESSVMLNATSAADACSASAADEMTECDRRVSRVRPSRLQRAARRTGTSTTLAVRRADCSLTDRRAAIGHNLMSSTTRYVTPPRFRTLRS